MMQAVTNEAKLAEILREQNGNTTEVPKNTKEILSS